MEWIVILHDCCQKLIELGVIFTRQITVVKNSFLFARQPFKVVHIIIFEVYIENGEIQTIPDKCRVNNLTKQKIFKLLDKS